MPLYNPPPAAGEPETFLLEEQESSGTSAGDASATTWHKRTITSVSNNITGASVSGSNQVTLPAGTYLISGYAEAWKVNRHKTRLRNTTDSTDDIIGSSAYSGAVGAGGGTSTLQGKITITSSKVFELQHYTEVLSGGGFGLGIAASTGLTEIFARLNIEKVA